MKTVYIKVEGHVQGVGFRYFTAMTAANNHINGWVHNTFDGHVEIEAEGEERNILLFIEKIKQGPPFSQVSNITVNDLSTPKGFKKFEIKY